MALLQVAFNDTFAVNVGKVFSLNIATTQNKLGTHELIVNMTMNGSGIRDIGRVLNISPTTVVNHLKNSTHLK